MTIQFSRNLLLINLAVFLGIAIIILCNNIVAGEKDPQWMVSLDDDIGSMDVSSDGNYSVISTNNELHFYRMNSPIELWNYSANDTIITTSISETGQYTVAGSKDNTVLLFHKNGSYPIWSHSLNNPITSTKISANGNLMVISSKDQLFLFGIEDNNPIWNYSADGEITSLDISSNGQSIAIGTENNTIYFFGNESNIPIWKTTIENVVNCLDLSEDGNYFAAGSNDHNVYLYQKGSNIALWNYTTDNDVHAVGISSEGEYIAVGSRDTNVYLFNKDESEPLWNYSTDGEVNIIAISADGNHITAGSGDRQLYCFNRDDNIPIWNYSVVNDIRGVDISTNGYYLVMHSIDNTIYIFTKVTAFIDSITPDIALRKDEIEFQCHGISDNGVVTQYVWTSNINEEFYNGSKIKIDTTLSMGEHIIGLKVMDEHGMWSPEVFAYLVVTEKPKAEIIDIEQKEIDNTYRVFFKGNGTAELGNITLYIWRSNLDGEFYRGIESEITVSNLSSGEHAFSLSVISSFGFESDRDIFGFNVNDIPVADTDLISPSESIFPEDIIFWGHGSDSGTIDRYVWSSDIDGEFYNGTDSTIHYSSLTVGEHMISLRVMDDLGFWSPYVSTILAVRNRPIAVIENVSQRMIFQGNTIIFKGNRFDEGPIQSLVWYSSIDQEIYNGSEKTFSSNVLSLGEHEITLTLQDDHGIWSNPLEITIWVIKKPKIDIRYIGFNVASFSLRTSIDTTLAIWVNDAKQSENLMLTEIHTINATLLNGNNSYYFEMVNFDDVQLRSQVFFIELTKTPFLDEPIKTATLRRNQYRTIPIALVDSNGKIIDALEKDTIIEINIHANKPIDILLIEEDDLNDWNDIRRGKSSNLVYLSEFSSLKVLNFSRLFITREDIIFYLIIENSDIIPRGAIPEGESTIEYSMMIIVSPDQGIEPSYDNDVFRVEFDEDTSDSGSSFTYISILFFVIILCVVMIFLADKKGIISIPLIPFFKSSTREESDEGIEEEFEENDEGEMGEEEENDESDMGDEEENDNWDDDTNEE